MVTWWLKAPMVEAGVLAPQWERVNRNMAFPKLWRWGRRAELGQVCRVGAQDHVDPHLLPTVRPFLATTSCVVASVPRKNTPLPYNLEAATILGVPLPK